MWQIQKNRNVILFFALNSFIYSISTSIYITGMIEQYIITKENIALLSLSSNISLMLFQIPAGYLLDKIGRKKTLIFSEVFGLIFFSIIILAFVLWSNSFQFVLLPLLIAGEVMRSLNIATFTPSQLTITTNLDENRRAESLGIVDFFTGIGSMPTGIIAGLLIANLHYVTPFIFTLMGILFMIWFLIKYFQDDTETKEEIMAVEK